MLPVNNDQHSSLERWDEIKSTAEWRDPKNTSILLGNGASRAIWDKFAYASLFDKADLDNEDRALFEKLDDTRNFEKALGALQIAELVCKQVGHDTSEIQAKIQERYDRIRMSLIRAVLDVHVRHARVRDQLQRIGNSLVRDYKAGIYSTNYDLLLYWAMMLADRPREWGDYFWNSGLTFEMQNREPSDDRTLVHYLHGGLHLYRLKDGRIAKRTGPGILEQLRDLQEPPFFVSEGGYVDKQRAIRSSDYLTWMFDRFRHDESNLVILGQSLRDEDRHISEALKEQAGRRIAVAVQRESDHEIALTKSNFRRLLPQAKLRFFDSSSHHLMTLHVTP